MLGLLLFGTAFAGCSRKQSHVFSSLKNQATARQLKGDSHFIASPDAQKEFSKLPGSIAGIYEWRLGVSPSGGQVPAEYVLTDGVERQRMIQEADYAFKQAIALCPTLPEAVHCYANFLVAQKRKPEALLIAQAAAHLEPQNMQYQNLARTLSRFSR